MSQDLPEEIQLSERAHNIRGRTFGKLTALRPVGSNQRGVLWLCECECGRHAIRVTAALRSNEKEASESQCAECAQELRRGTWEAKREIWRESFLLNWYERGNLYSEGQLKSMERLITEDLREIDFPVGERPPDTTDDHGHDQPEPYGAVCDGTEYILDEIGAEFDVTRERARQICLRAMSKLLQKHRRLFVSLLTGEFDWRSAAIEKTESEPEFKGCRCQSYDRSAPGHIYCKSCGRVWRVSEGQELRIITSTMLRRAAIFD
jgi:hypothetical protein